MPTPRPTLTPPAEIHKPSPNGAAREARTANLRRRLRELDNAPGEDTSSASPDTERGWQAAWEHLLPPNQRRNLNRRLSQAGLASKITPITFAMFSAGAILLGLVAGIACLPFLGPKDPTLALAMALLTTFVFAILPETYIRRRMDARKSEVERSLADTIDLLIACVEAGAGLDQALRQVKRTGTGPLTDEFGRVAEQVQLGRSRVMALREMAERLDMEEVRSFVSALCQAETVGAGVSEVLKGQALVLREKRLAAARERAQKLPVKMLFPLVFFVFPTLFLVVMGPGALRLIEMLGE